MTRNAIRYAYSFDQVRTIEAPLIEEALLRGEHDLLMREAADAISTILSHYVPGLAFPPDYAGPLAAIFSQFGEELEEIERLHAYEVVSEVHGADVVAFIGSGDNGGDALYALSRLMEKAQGEISCMAILLKKDVHPRACDAAQASGVEIIDASDGGVEALPPHVREQIEATSLWVDALLGIGIHGPAQGQIARDIASINAWKKRCDALVVSVDVPSGLTDAGGRVEGAIIEADATIMVGLYKEAALLPPAAAYSGRILRADISVSGPTSDVILIEEKTARTIYRAPGFRDHKYTRGVVGVVAGSDTYPGAGILATRGALGVGVGMVRLNSTRRVEDLVLSEEPGVVLVGGRIQAGVIGPGLDADRRDDADELAQFCLQSRLPLVVDAGALDEVEAWVRAETDLSRVVLTPHAGEAARLLTQLGQSTTRAQVEECPTHYAQVLTRLTGAVCVLKGAVTVIAQRIYERGKARDRLYVSPIGSPWAGVAGSGDVLAGIIAGTLARSQARTEQGGEETDIGLCAAAGVALHVIAGRKAAPGDHQYCPIQARDIAQAVPNTISGILGE